MKINSQCSLQIKQPKVVKSIIDSQVMQTTLHNYYITALRNVFKLLHPSIQIKHKKVFKLIYCSQVSVS